MRSDHCWSHGRGRPSASFQAGICTARARAFFDSVTASISIRMRVDVVLRLLLGQSERIDLHAVAEQPLLGIVDAVALGGDLVPQLGECAHLAQLGTKRSPALTKKEMRPTTSPNASAPPRPRP